MKATCSLYFFGVNWAGGGKLAGFGEFPDSLAEILLVLIPMVDSPDSIKQFRPIYQPLL